MPRRNLILAILLVVVCGCTPRLNDEKTLTDVDFNGKDLIVPSIRKERKVNIVAAASGSKVDVYVFLEANKDAAEKEILNKKFGANVLAHQLSVESATLSPTIPAGQNAIVRVAASGLKKATVKVSLTD